MIEDFNHQLKGMSQENQALRNELVMHEERQIRENETKKKVFLTDQPDYEDRVRGLLKEMENMNKQH